MTPPESSQNRLALEKSPYLLQHATNPVDWHSYGEEAFALARERDVPIFLSIGYSTCHWCHVMERESFEDEAIARYMNEHFVCIKVDREERPDVDQVYMHALMIMTGQGGWPLSAWLDHDLRPFFAGTYFPPDSGYGRPGFMDVLSGLNRTWHERREDLMTNATKLMEHLGRASLEADEGEVAPKILDVVLGDLKKSHDAEWGGFGAEPKFPRPSLLSLLLYMGERQGREETLPMVERTLDFMWRGGLYDHVGGGFARYSTDRQWIVPHFEKMLYDNAQLVDVYLDAYLATGNEQHAHVARDVCDYVLREMTSEGGGFYSAQDADSEGHEGKFYVFEIKDIQAALTEEDAAICMGMFGCTEEGNFEGKNILFHKEPLEEMAANLDMTVETFMAKRQQIRKQLYDWREQRIRPGLDDKVLASWNGMMIGAMAKTGVVLGETRFLAAAQKAASFVHEQLMPTGGGLLRRWCKGEARFDGSLDDYASCGLGFLSLFEATGESRWLELAKGLADQIEARFRDPAGVAFCFAEASEDLPVRMKDSYDGAAPSGNSMAALLLARLGNLLGNEDLRTRARQVAGAFTREISKTPQGYPVMILASRESLEPPRTLTVSGSGDDPEFRTWLEEAHREFAPGRRIIPVAESERDALAALGFPLEDKPQPEPGTQAILCENQTCRPWSPDS